MKQYLINDEWKIVEDKFHPEYNKISESVMSLGNGRMGHRANFEEQYSGETLQGNYVAGIYYPDKTRVGWWKNGYPEYFAKVLNAANWLGIDVRINNNVLDLGQAEVKSFRRELNMKEGHLTRTVAAKLPSGEEVSIHSQRLLSIVDSATGVIRYSLKATNFSGEITLRPYVDFDVKNEDSNYDEKFWDEVGKEVNGGEGYVTAEVRKTFFHVTSGMKFRVLKNGEEIKVDAATEERNKYIANTFTVKVSEGDEITIEKFGVNLSSEYHPKKGLQTRAKELLNAVYAKGFDRMLKEQIDAWAVKWETSDIIIEGDVSAQQGIRFNIFQLNQTYTGEDERLNIGPKGFTGEKYGGSTYWDTEAYCVPFYLATAPQDVSRNLLLYRHKHLQKAIENAEKLGFKNGAALYPMVTMNGEECHNEWEITFEEIHRNGAIAFAIYDYIRYTGDQDYLAPYGFEVLLGISRFWAQRVNWSEAKQKYVMLGVTGPNEYENNVNNNFHTNRMAQWTLRYTLEAIDFMKKNHADTYAELVKKWNLDETTELSKWADIIEKMYFPFDEKRGVFLQQDGFLDKDLTPAAQLPAEERPLNKNWSWDRILRSCYIKQADTLQSIFLYENEFDKETIRRHFDFYEPITVHESSLSPCIHTILASTLGKEEKAYEMYLRTARLDIDDYNSDTDEGCHITSMGGTWMAFVMGFGGMRVRDGRVVLNPFINKSWKSYAFRINFRGAWLQIKASQGTVYIENHSDVACPLNIYGNDYTLEGNQNLEVEHQSLITKS
ncbi:maltose phosphorylase [Prolixibacter bellariivorans]|uniref:Maltose phosphorylase n=2 Tax=Prolixibacter bellariivorans TaxID=314319 RepID=A0A5M4AYZ6_9BACT|nr:family 65 glycosyl hydrolase domain-containing protein [Prolixibacter bellariivorans]GET32823.1 maltose phosphorylase [Prolixibacter bellariivorans]